MWWHKLIRSWTRLDWVVFSAFNWLLLFGASALVRIIQGRSFELLYSAAISLAFIPISFLIIVAFQRYSSNSEEISPYSTLLHSDFRENKLSRSEKALVFFYADWCPFCRRSFPFLKNVNPNSLYKIFRVDLSDEDNPLWDSMKIETVPTLIAFEEGIEFWRVNGIPMIGLSEKDFKKADAVMKDSNLNTSS